MRAVGKVPTNERFSAAGDDISGRPLLVYSEQKVLNWMKDVVKEFPEAGPMMVCVQVRSGFQNYP